MTKILFICSGNVGRSQMAEAYYNHLTKTRDASSAGTDSVTPEQYPRMPDDIIEIMEEEGIDISNHNVKMVIEDMVKNNERVFVMCEKGCCPDSVLNSKKVAFWKIRDPYKMSIVDMKKIRDQIKAKVLSIT